MEKSILVKKISSLSRTTKEYIFNNFDNIVKTAIKIEAQNDPNQEIIEMINKRVKIDGKLCLLLEKLNLSPNNEDLKQDIIDDIGDIITEIYSDEPMDSPRMKYIENIENTFNSNPDQLIGEITSKLGSEGVLFLGGNKSVPIENTDQLPTVADPITNEKSVNERVYEIVDNGKKYEVLDGVFVYPIDDYGQPLIDKMDFLYELSDMFNETLETFRNNIEPLIELGEEGFDVSNNKKISKGSQITVETLEKFHDRFENYCGKKYTDYIDLMIRNRIKNKLGNDVFDKVKNGIISRETIINANNEILEEISKSDKAGDKVLSRRINTLDFYDRIFQDLFGYMYRFYLSETIGQEMYINIKKLSTIVYGDRFSDPKSDENLGDIIKKIKNGEVDFGQEASQLVNNIYANASENNIDTEVVFEDMFDRDQMKYYSAINQGAALYQLQRELIRIPDNWANLKYFCPKCGRFRPEKGSSMLLGQDEINDDNYYYKDPYTGLAKYNSKAYPDKPIPADVLVTLSPMAKEVISHDCNAEGGCDYEDLIKNFFNTEKMTQGDINKYWGFSPVKFQGETINQWTSDNPIYSDKKYESYLNSTFEKVVENMIKEGIDPELIKSDFKDMLKIGSNNEIYEDTSSPEINELINSSHRVIGYLKKTIENDQERMNSLREISNDTDLDIDEIKKFFAFKEFFRILPPDMPTQGWNKMFHSYNTYSTSAIKYEQIAPLLNKQNINEDFPLEYIHFLSSHQLKDASDNINRFIQNLVREYLLKENPPKEEETEEEYQENIKLIMNDFLKNETIKIPMPIKQPKKGTRSTIAELEDFRHKTEMIVNALSIQFLENEKGMVEDRDFFAYNASTKDLASMFENILRSFRSKPNLMETIDRDYRSRDERGENSLVDDYYKGKNKQDSSARSTKFVYIDSFKEAINSAIKRNNENEITPNEINLLFKNELKINGYKTLNPIEDYALYIMMKDSISKDFDIEINDIEVAKMALKNELDTFFKIAQRKRIYGKNGQKNLDGVYSDMAKIMGASKDFIVNLINDSSLDDVERYITPKIDGLSSRFREPYKIKEKFYEGTYPAGMDTLLKFLISDEKTSSAILKHTQAKGTFLEPQLRQIISILTMNKYQAKPEDADDKNFISTKEMAYHLSNAIIGGIPDRRLGTGMFGFGVKAVSLLSTIFKQIPDDLDINFLGESLRMWFSPNNTVGKTREKRTRTNDGSILDKEEDDNDIIASRNNWYKLSQKKSKRKMKFLDSVLIYTPADSVACMKNNVAYSKKYWVDDVSIPRITIVPFSNFGSIYNVMKFNKTSPFMAIIITSEDKDFLIKAGLIKHG